MVILTSSTSGTYKAQIRSIPPNGFKQLYTGTSTESEGRSARNLVTKWFGADSAETVRQVKDASEIASLTGDFFKDPKRKQVFNVWTFNHIAKPAKVVTKQELLQIATDINTPPAKRAKVITTEVVAPKAAVLLDASKSLEKLRKIVIGHEEKFAAATLGPRLQIGLQCLKAHQAFTHNPGKGGRPKKTVTRDGISTEGFEGWLASQAQWLKKPTAYKYMTAVRGLALDHDATEKQVAAALKIKLRKGPVTIKSLCDEALEAIGPVNPDAGSTDQQTEFEFIKDTCSTSRVAIDALVALKAQLDAYPDFKRVTMARLYSALHDISGTHWKPSDEPDTLANIDPDAITI